MPIKNQLQANYLFKTNPKLAEEFAKPSYSSLPSARAAVKSIKTKKVR